MKFAPTPNKKANTILLTVLIIVGYVAVGIASTKLFHPTGMAASVGGADNWKGMSEQAKAIWSSVFVITWPLVVIAGVIWFILLLVGHAAQ